MHRARRDPQSVRDLRVAGTVLQQYGDETAFREWLVELALPYVLGVRAGTSVWWGPHQPAPMLPPTGLGRPRTRLVRDAKHQPISVRDLAQALPAKSWRTLSWREGTQGALRSRFARVRVRAAHRQQARAEEWLLIEWPVGEAAPTHYWLATLPATVPFRALVAHATGRWMIERDYLELKSELGLSHYEGRNWRGFHHHATLCIAAYGFLMLERLRTKKKPGLDSRRLPYPRGSGRAGLGPRQRHVPWSIASARCRLARILARTLPECPCCGVAPRGSHE